MCCIVRIDNFTSILRWLCADSLGIRVALSTHSRKLAVHEIKKYLKSSALLHLGYLSV